MHLRTHPHRAYPLPVGLAGHGAGQRVHSTSHVRPVPLRRTLPRLDVAEPSHARGSPTLQLRPALSPCNTTMQHHDATPPLVRARPFILRNHLPCWSFGVFFVCCAGDASFTSTPRPCGILLPHTQLARCARVRSVFLYSFSIGVATRQRRLTCLGWTAIRCKLSFLLQIRQHAGTSKRCPPVLFYQRSQSTK